MIDPKVKYIHSRIENFRGVRLIQTLIGDTGTQSKHELGKLLNNINNRKDKIMKECNPVIQLHKDLQNTVRGRITFNETLNELHQLQTTLRKINYYANQTKRNTFSKEQLLSVAAKIKSGVDTTEELLVVLPIELKVALERGVSLLQALRSMRRTTWATVLPSQVSSVANSVLNHTAIQGILNNNPIPLYSLIGIDGTNELYKLINNTQILEAMVYDAMSPIVKWQQESPQKANNKQSTAKLVVKTNTDFHLGNQIVPPQITVANNLSTTVFNTRVSLGTVLKGTSAVTLNAVANIMFLNYVAVHNMHRQQLYTPGEYKNDIKVLLRNAATLALVQAIKQNFSDFYFVNNKLYWGANILKLIQEKLDTNSFINTLDSYDYFISRIHRKSALSLYRMKLETRYALKSRKNNTDNFYSMLPSEVETYFDSIINLTKSIPIRFSHFKID